MEPDHGGAIYLYSGIPIVGKDYVSYEMWLHGGESGGQQLKLAFLSGGAPVAEVHVSELLPEGIAPGEWVKVEASLETLDLADTVFDVIVIADASGVRPGSPLSG